MKHNFVKRTLAGLTAVLCVAGNAAATADTVLGGLLGGTAIVASAETKPLAVGTVYYIGDVVNFTQDAYVNRGSYTNKISSGEWKVNDSFYYIESDSVWRFEIQKGSSGWDIFCANTEPNKGKPQGVKCIEGDGTEANPYKFETYYETSVAGVTSGETTTNYADFAEALEAWTDGSTLTLREDVEITSTINVSASKTLDLNGHGITPNNDNTTIISIESGNGLTIKGDGWVPVIHNAGTLDFYDAHTKCISTKSGITNIYSGTIETPPSWTALNASGDGTVNVFGGLINPSTWLCVYANDNSTVNISGGVFMLGNDNSSNVLNTNKNGKINVSGGYFPEKISSAKYTLVNGCQLTDSDDADKGAKMVSAITADEPFVSVTSGETTTNYANLAEALAAWEDGSTLTLLEDVEITSTINVSASKTLDLNGHGIKMTGTGRVIYISNNANLTMEDSDPNAVHKYTIADKKTNGAGLAVVDDENGDTEFKGGYITGGKAGDNRGGGVLIDGGSFTMNGGVIIGNTANLHGGGVASQGKNDTFTMTGGYVIGNSGKYGGGISFIQNATCNISGGEISCNYSTNNGGGIHTDQSPNLIISGGSIINNYCSGTAATSNGGILVANGGKGLTLSGNPVIEGNMTNDRLDNIRLYESNKINVVGELTNTKPLGVTMSNSSGIVYGVFTNSTEADYNLADKFTTDDTEFTVAKDETTGQLKFAVRPVPADEAAVTVTSGDTTTNYATFAEALAAWEDGSTLTLREDAEIASTISVTGNKTLDLNGHGIKNTTGTSVITVASGASFTLNDSDPTFTDAGDNRPEGVTGGYLTGYNRQANDACVNVSGTFTMNGGSITGNNGQSGNCAGVIINNGGSFVMNDGSITNNSALYGTGVYCWNTGTFTMNGGTVGNNYAKNSGGGVLLHGTMNFNGGSVVDNTAVAVGGGILQWDTGTLKVSGDPIVTGNKKASGLTDNVYMKTVSGASKKITVVGELGDSAKIGVSMQNYGEFTNSTEADLNAADKFVSDIAGYAAVKDETSGQLKFAVKTVPADEAAVTVTIGETITGYGSLTAALADWTEGSTLTLNEDALIADTINVTGTKTLDMNGHGIRIAVNARVMNVAAGADLTIKDSAPDAVHYFTVTDGVAKVDDNGEQTFSFKGGYITGGNSASGGCINCTGKLTINGGTVIGNYSSSDGGGIYVSADGNAILNDGAVIYNKANNGGGVAASVAKATFTMNGGTVANNLGTGNTGGVLLVNGTFKLTGGSIVNNVGLNFGGVGIAQNASVFLISGDPVIKDNTLIIGAACNIKAVSRSKIADIDGELKDGAEIGVTWDRVNPFTVDYSKYNSELPSKYFFSDNESYVTVKTSEDETFEAKFAVSPDLIADGEYIDVAAFNAASEENPVLKLFEDQGTITITRADGTVDLNGYSVSTIYYQNNDPDKTVTIKNGTVTKEIDGAGGLRNDFKGKVVFEDLNVPSNNVWLDGHTLTIKSGNYNAIQNSTNLASSPLSVVTIEGGTFNTLNLGSKGEKYIISGGVFAKEPNEDWIAEGAVCTQRENDWLVSTYTAPKITFEKGDGCVKLTWDAVEGAEKYGVYGYMNGKWQELASGKGNSYVLKGLTAGKDYKVCVATRLNGIWFKDASNAIVVTPKLNTVKENPAVSYEKGKNAVKLTWDKVEGAQKYAVCGYAGGKWTILAEGYGNSYVMKDLKTGAEYKVAVAAMINGKWNTDFSNAIIVSPKEKRVPEYPTVKAQAYKDRFRVQWTAVEGAQKYGLAVYQKGKWVPKVQFDADTTEYISPSLKKGDYKCVIAAKVDGEWELGEADSRAFTVSIF